MSAAQADIIDSAAQADIIDSLDEIDRCVEVLRLVHLFIIARKDEWQDYEVTANVLGFTTDRVEIARDHIQHVFQKSLWK
ncbi:hypothetical protein [Rhizobium sp.]